MNSQGLEVFNDGKLRRLMGKYLVLWEVLKSGHLILLFLTSVSALTAVDTNTYLLLDRLLWTT